jgi:SAM-dependent methyltransferase
MTVLDEATRASALRRNSTGARCRACGEPLEAVFVDLGMSPLCETFLAAGDLNRMEPFYPLRVHVCGTCFLVQLEQYVTPAEIFGDYPYFSSYSDSWLRHAERYVEAACERFGLGPSSRVVEVGSNDGYLLQYFVARGIDALGVEPAANVAEDAARRGVPTLVAFFGTETADRLVTEGQAADLIVGNNVLAQVPDLHDFVEGLRRLLAPGGAITLEFPHLVRLMEGNQFDTIYHEHFSYFSLLAVERVLRDHGLAVFDVEELPSHGGSIRVFAQHAGLAARPATERVDAMRRAEAEFGLGSLETYAAFAHRVEQTKWRLLEFLIAARRAGGHLVGYGAPGKGNTLLNYCGIREDLLDYVVDRNPYKQGRFLPGTHIPIHHPDRILETRPDLVLILPWNLRQEIVGQMSGIAAWGGRFVVPIPEVEVIDPRATSNGGMR